ncbi:hypothetical protein PHJA_002404000 [Phtheirospermum japonicum]|uniref:Uncharacterized protein n=1 Tax=Phtheirospermum japonicum TaxID=374723 RepID=A0A830CU79_9LAMI|nr:hypothetical protein PHJA_002404000 [Phtheirospermum japonicum]
MHHLSTVSHHDHHLTAASESPAKYITTGCMNSTKRQAPLSPSTFQEPVSKRATLRFPSSPSTITGAAATGGPGGDDCHLFGFTRLPLPHPFPAASVASPLRRTVSEPIHFANAINPPAPPQQSSEFSIPPNPVLRQPLQDSFPFPNAAPVIHRTVSDPNPVANLQVVAAGGTPSPIPRSPLARNVPRSPSCGESPSAKRLRRMKERLREMSQWWNQVVIEGEEEGTESEKLLQANQKPKWKIHPQEAVWVEKEWRMLSPPFQVPLWDRLSDSAFRE